METKETITPIYNPDIEDFTFAFNGEDYTAKSLEISRFPEHISNHLKKHLADRILNKRGVRTNVRDDLEEIYKEIEVKI